MDCRAESGNGEEAGTPDFVRRIRRDLRKRVRHCEAQCDEAIQNWAAALDCFASLAMTRVCEWRFQNSCAQAFARTRTYVRRRDAAARSRAIARLNLAIA
jgi:hypothetical protein